MGSYEVRALHNNQDKMRSVKNALVKGMSENKKFLKETDQTAAEAVEEMDFHDGWLMTDDFTPEQALTRMAYKTFGEIVCP